MIGLKGADELGRLVMKKWGYSSIEECRWVKGVGMYVRGFSCPECKGRAVEICLMIISEDPECIWRIDWVSPCGHAYGGTSCKQMDDLIVIEENGVAVGHVVASGGPPWRRHEDSVDEEIEFGTLFQATHASHNECRLLAEVQESERRSGGRI